MKNKPRITDDCKILIGAALSLILLVIVSCRPRLLSFFATTPLESFLVSDITANIISSILASVVAAYIFYCIIDLFPRKKKAQSILDVLNLLINSIVDAYETGNAFSHEKSIIHLDDKKYSSSYVRDLTCKVKNLTREKNGKFNRVDYVNLYYAMECAHSRLYDFENALSLAVSHSPEVALRWLVITDKVRLMADAYKRNAGDAPDFAQMKEWGKPSNYHEHGAAIDFLNNIRFSTYQLRTLEYLESARDWLEDVRK